MLGVDAATGANESIQGGGAGTGVGVSTSLGISEGAAGAAVRSGDRSDVEQRGVRAARAAAPQRGDDPALMGRILRQPNAESFRSLGGMLGEDGREGDVNGASREEWGGWDEEDSESDDRDGGAESYALDEGGEGAGDADDEWEGVGLDEDEEEGGEEEEEEEEAGEALEESGEGASVGKGAKSEVGMSPSGKEEGEGLHGLDSSVSSPPSRRARAFSVNRSSEGQLPTGSTQNQGVGGDFFAPEDAGQGGEEEGQEGKGSGELEGTDRGLDAGSHESDSERSGAGSRGAIPSVSNPEEGEEAAADEWSAGAAAAAAQQLRAGRARGAGLHQQHHGGTQGYGASNGQTEEEQQQTQHAQYTLLVPSLAACCPLLGQQPFGAQQEAQLHAGLDAGRLAQLAWSLSVFAFVPQPSWLGAYTRHVSFNL